MRRRKAKSSDLEFLTSIKSAAENKSISILKTISQRQRRSEKKSTVKS